MLKINLSTLIFQVVNFLIMTAVLTKFLFRPVVRLLDERAKRVTKALDEAERREREATRLKEEYLRKMAEAREEIRAMRERAQEEAERLRQQAVEQAAREAQALRAGVEEELERERKEAIARHRHEIGSIVTSLTARMLTEVGDGRLQQLFLDALLKQLRSLEDDLARYRDMVKEMEAVPVDVISAYSLSRGDLTKIKKALSSLLDKDVELRPRVDPSLIGGAMVRFSDVLIDGSLKGQLTRLQERFVEELEAT